MNLSLSFSILLRTTGMCLLVAALSGCDQPEPKHSKKKSSDAKADKESAKNTTKGPKIIEAFTGAHTRVVWAENQAAGHPDSFARGTSLVLKGIDTRDGKGERKVLHTHGNYSRPLLSSNGETILYTDKNLSRDKRVKHYKPVIYRTDWTSGKATRVAEGYAVDSWRDPATGTEWVYAVRGMRSTTNVSLEANTLVRFPLESPDKVEMVYNDTVIGPDNIQLSRDGMRACGLFPWPHTGVFKVEDGKWAAHKLQVGCWPSMAPDDSGVSWVFDGEHRSATFFDRDGTRRWMVKLNTGPRMKNHEVYHPRWSNHPRYLVVTGPYTKEKDSEGSVINKGGATAQIYIGRLAEDASKVEAWQQITGDNLAESYPDLWIADGDKASLVMPKPALTGTPTTSAPARKWPSKSEGLTFLWENRDALNSYTARSGQKLAGRLNLHLAAHYGRRNELLLGGGSSSVEPDSATLVLQHLQKKGDMSFEAVVVTAESMQPEGNIFRGPDTGIGVRGGALALTFGGITRKGKSTLPNASYHLAVTRKGAEIAAFVNGKPLDLMEDAGAPVPASPEAVIFGGGWNGGLLHIALYDHTLSPEDVSSHAQYAIQYLNQLPPPPARVTLRAKLTEVSAMPTPEGIDPYTSALVVYLYEVEKVLDGSFTDKTILVKHWAMLGQKPVVGLPREVGKSYDLVVERESAHTQLKGERIMDDTAAFDMEPWFDVSSPRVTP